MAYFLAPKLLPFCTIFSFEGLTSENWKQYATTKLLGIVWKNSMKVNKIGALQVLCS